MASQCSICLNSFKGLKNKTTLECGHEFHYTCIFEWNKKNTSCPLCRSEQEISLEKKEEEQPKVIRTPLIYGLQLTCSDCNSELINCVRCNKKMCLCLINHRYHNGRNPFMRVEDVDDECMCSDCFTNFRDDELYDGIMNSITDRTIDDIWDSQHLHEVWLEYYRNYTDNRVDDLSEFDNYEDFVSYAQTLLESEINYDLTETV